MAQAPVTGEYPKDKDTPALTVPFAKAVKGAPIVLANLSDPKHPINITSISGKTRGATILLDDNSLYMALGHRASDAWVAMGQGGGGGEGTVKSVNGVEPDEAGNIELVIPKGTVTSINGVEPNAEGAVTINVVKTVNGNGPDGSGNINVSNKLELTYFSDATLTISDASDGKLYVCNGTDQKISFAEMTKSIQCAVAGVAALTVTQGAATQFICEGDWAAAVPAGRMVNMLNNGNLWVLDRPAAP